MGCLGESLFYSDGWHQEVDCHLIIVLWKMCAGPRLINLRAVTNPAQSILSFICNNLNDSYGSQFPESVLDQMKKLRTRHQVLSSIIGCEGVSWDKRANSVQAVDEVWEAIVVVHPFADAYRWDGKGEVFWDELVVIFGDRKEGEGSGK